MKSPSAFHLLINGAGVLIGLVVVGYVVYAALRTEEEPPCTSRYPAPMRFGLLANDGKPLSPLELQARAGLREWGVIENATVAADERAPAGAALQVKLAMLTSEGEVEAAGRPRNGLDFRWTVTGAKAATAACLSYSVWLPEKFDFNEGGTLPGIAGGSPDTPSAFGARLQWRVGGEAELAVATAGAPFRPVNQPNFLLQRGRWSQVEQEIVLNTPGAEDGLARLWIDGKLKAEDTTVAFRSDAGAGIAGVTADVGYWRAPAKPGELRLSAFELAWQ
jgi:hypothetical protein